MSVNRNSRLVSRPLLGLAIGDALGKPFEEIPGHPAPGHPEDWNCTYLPGRKELVGEYGVPPGHFTDDTQMSLALAQALLAKGEYSRGEALRVYSAWAKATGADAPRGMGGTIKTVLDWLDGDITAGLFRLTEKAVRANEHPMSRNSFDNRYVGSGTAMRAAPIGAFFPDIDAILQACKDDAYLTHASIEAAAGSFAVAVAVRHCIDGYENIESVGAIVRHICDDVQTHFPYTRMATAATHVDALTWESFTSYAGFRTSGDVVDVVTSALGLFLCYSKPEQIQEVLYESCTMGGDADTRTAILGALLGARWGTRQFPTHLVDQVERREEIMKMEEKLVRFYDAP